MKSERALGCLQVMDKDNLIRNNMVAQVTCSRRKGTAQHSTAKRHCFVPTFDGLDQSTQARVTARCN